MPDVGADLAAVAPSPPHATSYVNGLGLRSSAALSNALLNATSTGSEETAAVADEAEEGACAGAAALSRPPQLPPIPPQRPRRLAQSTFALSKFARSDLPAWFDMGKAKASNARATKVASRAKCIFLDGSRGGGVERVSDISEHTFSSVCVQSSYTYHRAPPQ